MTEYALLLAGVAFVALAGYKGLGNSANGAVNSVSQLIASNTVTAGAGAGVGSGGGDGGGSGSGGRGRGRGGHPGGHHHHFFGF